MTSNKTKLRSLFLTALMVFSVFAGTVVLSSSVAAQDRTIGAGNTAPITVYQGESVDFSGVDSTDGTTASGTVGLTGTAGDADGTFLSDSASNFDFGDAETGAYSYDNDDNADVFVREPTVSDVTLYRGSDDTGADITDGSVTTDTDDITVQADFNFDDAEGVEVTVEDEDNVDITNSLTGSNTIATDGGTLTLSGISSLDAGQYNVTVEGEDSLDSASRQVSFTVRSDETTISLQDTEVTQGDRVTGTVQGSPGDTVHVRVDQADTDSGTTATQVFRNTGDVTTITDQSTNDGGTTYHAVVLDLGDSGSAQFQVETNQFEPDTTNSLEVALGADVDNSAEDDVDLTVNERDITIDSAPNAVVIGEDFTVNGTAAESDTIRAYARIDDTYRPLVDDDGNAVETSVDTDGTYEFTVDSSQVINLPDSYRIAVTADDGNTPYDTGATLSSSDYGEVDTRTTTTIQTQEGELAAELSSSRIASGIGDEVTLSGTALGQDDVRVFVVGPRGTVQDVSGNTITGTTSSAASVSINDNEFEEDLSGLDNRGTYEIYIVGDGRDGNYDESSRSLGSTTQSQALEIIEDAYQPAGSDNPSVNLSLEAENPSLSINEPANGSQVPQDTVTVSGDSNREDETTVFIEVLDDNDNAIASTEAEVNGSSSSWSTDVDMSGLETGEYTLRADDSESSDTVTVEVVEGEAQTPEPTEEETEEPTEPMETEEPTEPMETEMPTEEETTTGGSGPGFTAAIALIALIAAALLAVRRNN